MGMNYNYGLGVIFTATDLASGVIRKVSNTYAREFGHMSDQTKSLQGGIAALGLGLGTLAVGGGIRMAYRGFANAAGEFEKHIRAAGASAQATEAQINAMRDTALKTGTRGYAFNPTEAAKQMLEFARSGYTVAESMKMVTPTLDFAASSFGEITAKRAAYMAAQTLRGFGKEAGDTRDVLNQISKATVQFNMSASDMPLALGVATKGSFVLKQSLEDTLLAIGMVKNIIPGPERAGTAVSSFQDRFGSTKSQKALKSIGVSIFDDKGKIKSMIDTIAELEGKLDRLPDPKLLKFYEDAFGNRSKAGITAIMNAIRTGVTTSTGEVLQGTKAIEYWRKGLADAAKDDFMSSLLEQRLKTFAGQKEVLKATMQDLAIEIGRPFETVLAGHTAWFVKIMRNVTKAWHELPEDIKLAAARMTIFTGRVFLAVGGFVTLHTLVRFLAPAFTALWITMRGIGAVMTGPWMLAIAGIAGAVVALRTIAANNFGFMADRGLVAWNKLKFGFLGLMQLLQQGFITGPVLQELKKAGYGGVLNTVIELYGWISRVQEFFNQFANGWTEFWGSDWGKEVLDTVYEAIDAVARWFGITRMNAKDAATAFDRWGDAGRVAGQIIAFAVGTVMVAMAGLTIIVDRVIQALDWLAEKWEGMKDILYIGGAAAVGAMFGGVGALPAAGIMAAARTGVRLGELDAQMSGGGIPAAPQRSRISMPDLKAMGMMTQEKQMEYLQGLINGKGAPMKGSIPVEEVRRKIPSAVMYQPQMADIVNASLMGREQISQTELRNLIDMLNRVANRPVDVKLEVQMDGQVLLEASRRLQREDDARSGIPVMATD